MPLHIDIPGGRRLTLEHLVLDVNGTLTNRGELIEGAAERVRDLASTFEITLVSADTFGTLAQVAEALDVRARLVETGEEKARFVRELGGERCVAIGNGANDAPMLEMAGLGIAVVGPEGAATAALHAADIACASIVDALDLLRDERVLAATLRP